MKIGLFFGSFNPIHNGHISIAESILKASDIEKIWFVVSPQNPLKPQNILIDENHRLKMVEIATEKNSKLEVCDIEFSLSKPSFTYKTLDVLRRKYSEHTFIIIMGSDSINNIHKWKEYKKILSSYKIFVYPRGENKIEPQNSPDEDIEFFNFPMIDISSTKVRELIKEGKTINKLTHASVIEYINLHLLYS
ncbi:MAG: nicotinate (nicotinamide) nucleotide adenylyltransferase [Bacteroidota bacterium]|nr:nicotinate (nicotinamide) nucleotide adenylyltransferase [Bacteroidota bacterium]